jgi:signal transduction histidine kinase
VQASQAKSDFLTVMSHELRTPLTTVIGYAELLVDEVSGPVSEQQRQQLGRIQASAGQLLQLIEEILAFSRVDAGREQVRRERCDVARIAHDAALLIEPSANGRDLRFVERIPMGGAWSETDPGKVRQIVVNLLSNALKFTERGEIGIAVGRDGRWVVLEVWDTGIGISPPNLAHIFDPFWQVEHPAARRAGGTGLGLSVTRHLARLLGGDVRVESTPGRGSRFRVQLPASI